MASTDGEFSTFDLRGLRLVTDLKPLALARGWPYRVLLARGEEPLASSEALLEEDGDERRHREWAPRHHYATGESGLESVRGWYERLRTPGRQGFAETFLCEVPDALLVGSLGIVVTPQWEVLSQSNIGAPPGSAMLWTLKEADHPVPATSAGAHVSLLTFASRSYGHWLLDSLPRVPAADSRRPDCRFVVPAEPTRFQIETLHLLGVDEARIVRQEAPVLRTEILLLVRTAGNLTEPRTGHLLALRDRLLEAVYDRAGPPAATERVYVSRGGATRPVVNESEILPLLRDHGFHVVRSDELSFREQVELFSRARVVMGAHGAGLHNHIFNPGPATVVELLNPRLWTPSVLRTASICHHRHCHAFVENVGNRLETYVDPERLRRLLEELL